MAVTDKKRKARVNRTVSKLRNQTLKISKLGTYPKNPAPAYEDAQ